MPRVHRPESHQSDQDVRDAATAYTDLLAGRGVALGMAAVGKPEEHGFGERLMGTNREEVELSEYQSPTASSVRPFSGARSSQAPE
jgi:transposase InsO family protein